MIALCCPGCQQKFFVNDELAGQTDRCPGCGKTVTVPKEGWDSVRVPTHPSASSSYATQAPPSPRPGNVDDPYLTELLAPPEADGELGRLGKYRILKVLGHGGMGVVFLAEDPKLKRMVALKAMLPALAASATAGQRFLREAQAMAAVEHDHIVRIYQVDEERSVPFLAMELLKGEPLDKRLKREGKLPLPEAVRIGREIAEALAVAHATGLIHRDVKPANVWLEAPCGRVKILDFGLARAASQEGGLTQQGAIIGTPAYMSPELTRGEIVDARSDLFSLGVVLYRMLTGQQPFQGKDAVSTLLAVASDTPPPPARRNPATPQKLSDLVMRLLEKDPQRRPASAGEVAEALRAFEEAKQGQARTNRRRVVLAIAIALFVLLPVAWWLAAVVLRVETANGTLVVEINDAETEARIKGGKLVLSGPDGKVCYTLSPGERDREIEAGPYKVRVEGADGLEVSTPQFTLKKGGKVTVRVTMEPRAVVQALDPDRQAAQWVLSLGGTLKVNGQEREVKAAADLPPGSFLLTGVDLHANKQVSDAGCAHFKHCKSLTYLNLNGTKVSDAGLAAFKGCKHLTFLDLWGTKVSDAGLAAFKDCEHLTFLGLGRTRVSDAGLAAFKECKHLTVLALDGTQVSSTGLAHFQGCTDLTYLHLGGTQVSKVGLAYFKNCKKLTYLYLGVTQVSDVGLAYFKNCKKLTYLDLSGTKVSDLTPLQGLPLKDLRCDFKAERDAKILRSLPTLETINGKPAKEFWAEVDAKKP
jgi:hypothetical protein